MKVINYSSYFLVNLFTVSIIHFTKSPIVEMISCAIEITPSLIKIKILKIKQLINYFPSHLCDLVILKHAKSIYFPIFLNQSFFILNCKFFYVKILNTNYI